MSAELPRGWCLASAQDLLTYVTSGSRSWAKYYSQSGAMFLRIANLDHNSIHLDLRDIKFVKPPESVEGTRTLVRAGDILVSITADVGMIALVPSEIGEAYINQHIALARPIGGISREYLAWYFTSMEGGQAQFQDRRRGATKVGLALDDITGLNVQLAPLAEQHRITAKLEALLSKVDACRTRLERIPTILKRFRQSVLAAACSGRLTADWREENSEIVGLGGSPPPEMPESPQSWTWQMLAGIAAVRGGVTKGRKLGGKKTLLLPYLRVANVQDGFLDLKEIKQIEALPEDQQKYRLEVGDILFTEGGDRDKLGRGAVWQGQISGCIHQNHIFRARLLTPSVTPAWVSLVSKSDFSRTYFFENASQTVNLASINLTTLAALPVPIPPLPEQHEIVRRVEALFAHADRIEAHYAKAKASVDSLTQSILAKAFRGELVPTEAEIAEAEGRDFESAEQLLARIRGATPNHHKRRRGACTK